MFNFGLWIPHIKFMGLWFAGAATAASALTEALMMSIAATTVSNKSISVVA